MKQVRVLVVGVLLGLMLGMGWVYAQQGSRAALMPQDYSEIGQLYATLRNIAQRDPVWRSVTQCAST